MTAPAWLDELNLDAGSPWVSMGTRALTDGLFLRDDDYERDLEWKLGLLTERHGEVFAALDTPEVARASAEVLDLVHGTVRQIPSPTRNSTQSSALHPLDAAGRMVQEDLCILVLRDGAPYLDAASLCFPSYWRLADKLGRPLADVHGPVPHYATELAAKVDGFLRRLSPGRTVWRRNWSIHDDPAYFQPVPSVRRAAAAVPDDLYLRSERQVLRRLVTSDAVLFTIRTQQAPLAVVAERPDIALRMAHAIAAWSPHMAEYKGGHGASRAVEWLKSRSV